MSAPAAWGARWRRRWANSPGSGRTGSTQYAIRNLGIPGFVAYIALWAAFARTTWRVYTWAPDEGTRRLVLGISAGLLAHQIFGLTDAFMLGTKPGIVMWILMGIITGLYLELAPVQRGMRNDEC